MNWMGGNLQRHSKLNANKTSRAQQQHFAKTKSRVQISSRAVSPIRLSTFAQNTRDAQPFPATSDDKEIHRQAGSGLSREPSTSQDYDVERDVRKQGGCSNDHIKRPYHQPNTELLAYEESCFGQSFEDVKHRLLRRADWLGVSAAQPLQITFPPVKLVENIGRHRRVEAGGDAAHLRTHGLPPAKRIKIAKARSRATPSTSSSRHSMDTGDRAGSYSCQMQHTAPMRSRHPDRSARSSRRTPLTSRSIVRMKQFSSSLSPNDSSEGSYGTPAQAYDEVSQSKALRSSLHSISSFPAAINSRRPFGSCVSAEGLSYEHNFPNSSPVGGLSASNHTASSLADLASTKRFDRSTESPIDSVRYSEATRSWFLPHILSGNSMRHSQNHHDDNVSQKNFKDIEILSSPYFVSPTQPIENEYHPLDTNGPNTGTSTSSNRTSLPAVNAYHRLHSRHMTSSVPRYAQTTMNQGASRISQMTRQYSKTPMNLNMQSLCTRSDATARYLGRDVLEQNLVPPKHYGEHGHESYFDNPVSSSWHKMTDYVYSPIRKSYPMARSFSETATRSRRLYDIRLTGGTYDFTERVRSDATDSNAIVMKHVFSEGAAESRNSLRFLRNPWAEKQVATSHPVPDNPHADNQLLLSSMTTYNSSTTQDPEEITQSQSCAQSRANTTIFGNEQRKFTTHINSKSRFPPRSSPSRSNFDEQTASLSVCSNARQSNETIAKTTTPERSSRLAHTPGRFSTKRNPRETSSDHNNIAELSFIFPATNRKQQNRSVIPKRSSPLSTFRFPVRDRHDVPARNKDAPCIKTNRNFDDPPDLRVINNLNLYDDNVNPCTDSAISSSCMTSSRLYDCPDSNSPSFSRTDSSKYIQAHVTSDSLQESMFDNIHLPVTERRDSEFRVPPELLDEADDE